MFFSLFIVPLPVTIHKRRFSIMGNKRVEEAIVDITAPLAIVYTADSMKKIESVSVTGPTNAPIGAQISFGLTNSAGDGALNGVDLQAGGSTAGVNLKVIGI